PPTRARSRGVEPARRPSRRVDPQPSGQTSSPHPGRDTRFPLTFARRPMSLTEEFLKFSLLGAEWVLWLLVVLSVLSVYVMIERALFFRGVSGADTEIRRKLIAALNDDDLDAAARTVEHAAGPGGRMVREMLPHASK